jgi:CheY-specific phosphatase CheX
MTLSIKDIGTWSEAFIESVEELGETFLGEVELIVQKEEHELPERIMGSFVQVVGPEGPVLLGVTGSPETCDGLARLMLQMEPNEEIDQMDMTDALGEIINIAAGGIKNRLSPTLGDIELGLPLFVTGALRAIGHIEVRASHSTLGCFPCTLVVLALTGR